MTDAELLAKAVAFDAGEAPVQNWFVVEDDDPVDPGDGHPMRIERRRGGWAIRKFFGSSLDAEAGWFVPDHKGTLFATPAEAFAFLDGWKARQRALAIAQGCVRWKDELARIDAAKESNP